MKVVIIGSGNVASHIANALHQVGINVAQIWSYHYENALLLANEVKAVAIKDFAELDNDAELCLISIKDDAIKSVIENLRAFKGVIAHTSGSVSINVFASLNVSNGVFYPLQTFSKNKAITFSNVPLCLEANDEKTLNLLSNLASKISNKVIAVNSEKRKVLHLAAVFAGNFTNHLYALANEILKTNDLAFDIIRPLIAETANKVQNELPLSVQTGPAIRDDKETLKKQEEMLAQQPNWLEIYKTLSNSIKKTR